jgi:protein O-GlcNAc transferase
MNIRAWAHALPNEFWKWGTFSAVPYELRRYADVLDTVQGMTTPSTMHLLNVACQHLAPGECYLEVGTWRGATLIGALLGNSAYGVAVDDDSMDEHDGDDRSSYEVWLENTWQFGMKDRAAYVNGSVPEVFIHQDFKALMLEPTRVPVGVYLFDGDKSTPEAAYAGLIGVLPFLADEALIVVDDANEMNIRLAVAELERASQGHALKVLDIPTPGNCWPMWWNGVMALAWQR